MFRRRHLRQAKTERKRAESDHILKRVEAQWTEVHELTSWAKRTREANHLTALFIKSLGGSS